MADKLAKTPPTRRAQAITWQVWEDNFCYDPACLQSIWCRMLADGDTWRLNINVRFRSNDADKAAFINMFALLKLQGRLCPMVADRSGLDVRPGRYRASGRQLPHLRLILPPV